MSKFIVGSWIPTFELFQFQSFSPIPSEPKTYDVSDGAKSKLELTVCLKPLQESKVSFYDLKGNLSLASNGREKIKVVVEKIRVYSSGILWARVLFDEKGKDLTEKFRKVIYLKLFQRLKELFHKHLFHHEEQDAILPVLESELIGIECFKDRVIEFIVGFYQKKFQEYLEFISGRLQKLEELFDEIINISLSNSVTKDLTYITRVVNRLEFLSREVRDILVKFLGELAFFKAFANLHGVHVLNSHYELSIEAFRLKMVEPLDLRAYRLGAVGGSLGVLGAFLGIIGLLVGLLK